jgi:hypothetical protein
MFHVKQSKEKQMKQDFKIDGKGVLIFLKRRKVVLENRNNEVIIDLQLLWFLLAMIFLSGIIIVGLIISLFFGCKISIINTTQGLLDKDSFK